MECFEVGALAAVPVTLSVLVIGAILSQLVRALFFLLEQAARCYYWHGSAHWSKMEERKPLLDYTR